MSWSDTDLSDQLGTSPSEGQMSDVTVQVENGPVSFNIRLNGSEEVLESYGRSVVLRKEVTAESQWYWSYEPHVALLRRLVSFHQQET